VTRYLLDTTVLIDHLRGDAEVQAGLLGLLAQGHILGTSCVNVSELASALRPKERKAATALIDRLDFLVTTREAAERAGRYQADSRQQGRTIHTADAMVAGTARVHGAVVVTDNVKDFPMPDLRVKAPRDVVE
jgi:predicted nucleic acid-binding protein